MMKYDVRMDKVISKRATREEIEEFKRGDIAEQNSPIAFFNLMLDGLLRQLGRKDIYNLYLEKINEMEVKAATFN